ncbi:MAG: MaoC family dehydratase N-terminal domain-containing protein [Dehalococcoidia bacterium]
MTRPHAVITDDMVADLRARLGVDFQPRDTWFNVEATKDAIRHFSHGIGDDNPLWCDEEYARKSQGGLMAPPCFLYSIYWPIGTWGGLPGIHAFHSGNDWTWYKPLRLGDSYSVTEKLTDVTEKPSRYAGRMIVQVSESTFRNQRDEVVATARGWCVRAERANARKQGKYSGDARAVYTPEQLLAIDGDYDREVVRGANPRYWEDVREGDELTPVVKGPLSMRDIIAWCMGAGSYFMKAHRLALAYRRRHPASAMQDNTTGAQDVPELVHMEDSRAQEIGIPGAYDYGPQRISWLGHLVTNWMGDEGFLQRLYAELRLFNVIGDTTWCRGKVTRKYIQDGQALVDLEIRAENQRGEITAPGQATVRLPRRQASGQESKEGI